MGNDSLSGKQVGSQASRRVTQRLAWIQPVFISINAVPTLKGLTVTLNSLHAQHSLLFVFLSKYEKKIIDSIQTFDAI